MCISAKGRDKVLSNSHNLKYSKTTTTTTQARMDSEPPM